MLLARRESQNKTAPSLLVISFADQTSGNLARIFLARGKQADIRPTKRKWHTKRLTFSDDNVRATRARRLQQTERDRFGDRNDQQRADRVRLFSQSGNVFDATKEVWRLNNERGGFVVEQIYSARRFDRSAGSIGAWSSSIPACCT